MKSGGAFELKSDYTPAGDQPGAIEAMVTGLRQGLAHQTLLGVTGSGKTFSIANVVAEVNRPTLVMAPNKTLAAQLYGEFKAFFPNNAVYLVEEFLEGTTEPYYGGEVDYGDRAAHCWNGDQAHGNYLSRLRYNSLYLPKILERIEKTAPPGADLTSWRY